jgi:SAM-dependent methyltransferase
VLAALAGIAIDRDVPEGVDRPIAPILGDRVPAEADPRVNEIRVGHLLAMRAGPERTSGRNHGRWVASPDRVRFALSRPFVDAPGGGMLHSTGSSHLHSAVLTRASGRATRSGTGLADRVRCQPGSATDLPFAAGNFDLVTLLHVGMNVPDKARPCAETARVPRPGGRFAVCDVMRTGEGALAGYRLALEVFGRMRARYAADEPPPGPHLVPGAEAPRMVANMIAGLERGIIAPGRRDAAGQGRGRIVPQLARPEHDPRHPRVLLFQGLLQHHQRHLPEPCDPFLGGERAKIVMGADELGEGRLAQQEVQVHGIAAEHARHLRDRPAGAQASRRAVVLVRGADEREAAGAGGHGGRSGWGDPGRSL